MPPKTIWGPCEFSLTHFASFALKSPKPTFDVVCNSLNNFLASLFSASVSFGIDGYPTCSLFSSHSVAGMRIPILRRRLMIARLFLKSKIEARTVVPFGLQQGMPRTANTFGQVDDASLDGLMFDI